MFASRSRLYSVFKLVILASHKRPPRLYVTLRSLVSNTVMSASNSLPETSATTAAKMETVHVYPEMMTGVLVLTRPVTKLASEESKLEPCCLSRKSRRASRSIKCQSHNPHVAHCLGGTCNTASLPTSDSPTRLPTAYEPRFLQKCKIYKSRSITRSHHQPRSSLTGPRSKASNDRCQLWRKASQEEGRGASGGWLLARVESWWLDPCPCRP